MDKSGEFRLAPIKLTAAREFCSSRTSMSRKMRDGSLGTSRLAILELLFVRQHASSGWSFDFHLSYRVERRVSVFDLAAFSPRHCPPGPAAPKLSLRSLFFSFNSSINWPSVCSQLVS